MSETANQTDKKEFSWSDVDESPVIPTAVPTQEPPSVDLSASVSNLLDTKPESEAKPESEEKPQTEQKTPDVSAAESVEEKKTELNQEMIEALLNKLMEFDDMPPLVDDDEIPDLAYSSDDSCPRCNAALKVLLSNRRHPVIRVDSDESEDSEETEDSEESQEPQESQDSEDTDDSDSDYIPSESETSEPPTPRTLADRQVNVPSAIQYITVILAIVYLLKFYFFINESRIRYRPCT
jgi:hypothetical protein